MKEQKTNVMRILDQKKIPYEAKHYPHGDDAVDGVTVAQSLGQDPASVFKTLVTHGAKGGYYVFVIPVAEELDLKKAAKAVGEKSVAMLHVKELLPLTGYVRGGCSPIGMEGSFPPPSTLLRWSRAPLRSPPARSAIRCWWNPMHWPNWCGAPLRTSL